MSARLLKRIVCFYSDIDFGMTTHLVHSGGGPDAVVVEELHERRVRSPERRQVLAHELARPHGLAGHALDDGGVEGGTARPRRVEAREVVLVQQRAHELGRARLERVPLSDAADVKSLQLQIEI